jgi:hypothetical protein
MSYNSIPVAEIPFQLTDDDRRKLAELKSPDDDRPELAPSYHHDFRTEQQILTLLFQSQGWNIGSHYDPSYFEDDCHAKVFKLLKESWERNGAIMSKDVLLSLLDEKYGDSPHIIQMFGEVEAITQGLGSVADGPAIQTLMIRFAQEQGKRKMISDLLKNRITIDDFIAKGNELKNMRWNKRDNPIQTWKEMRAEADAERQEWIIEGLMQTKSLNMISGRSFSGKTTLVNKAIAAICEGGDFLGHRTNPVAVCYLNCDRNRVSRIVRKVYNNLEGNDRDGILAKRFFTVHLDSLSTTLTPNDLKVYHKALQKHVGDTPILFIVDTFRSAFLAEAEIGSTNDDATMVKLLKPIQEWAIQSGNCVLLVHHNTKSVDDFAGSGAYLMLLETKMNYKRSEEDQTGELHIITRDDLCLTYFIRLDEKHRPYRTDGRASGDDPYLLKNIALCFGSGRSITDAFTTYKAGGGKYQKRTFQDLAKVCETEGRLVVKEQGAGNKPSVYGQA